MLARQVPRQLHRRIGQRHGGQAFQLRMFYNGTKQHHHVKVKINPDGNKIQEDKT